MIHATLLVLALVLALPQPPPIIGPTEAIGFDYLDADLTTFSVTSFEVQWDGGAWVSLGLPAARVLPTTQLGASTYTVIPPFTGGSHTAAFRAVNVAGPGGASNPPFAFAFAGSPPTGVPANVRKVPRGGG